jgi:hypothetical protein
MRRVVTLVVSGVVALVVALVGAGGAASVLASPASASTRAFGSVPVDDVIAAANTHARPDCGLGADRLAAMMVAPVFHETGAVNSRTTSPSPMTLGRWDNQAGLYAFGNPATTLRRAFWHPGIGMWQFDSAGFWNMTAADKISSRSSADQAAATMASRFCSSTASAVESKMAFAWSPWYACVSGSSNLCLARFNEAFQGGRFTNIVRDPTVGRLGGMVPTTCRIGGTTEVACHRVDPAAAEGFNVWTAAGAGPAPLTAPFYVYAVGDTEYRYWLSADTGYTSSIRAFKPIRANARNSLTWQNVTAATGLCDLRTNIGDCQASRVADTPWGPRSADPFGNIDAAVPGAGALTVRGWAIDPDTNDPISVHVYVDGRMRAAAVADVVRADVARAVPGYGDRHGFAVRVTGLEPGSREVCVYGINVGPWGTTNPELGMQGPRCRTVVVSAPPQGNLEVVRMAPGGVQVVGWAADTDDPATVDIEVTIDAQAAGGAPASRRRNDVAASQPWFGAERGFNVTVPVAEVAAARTVCVNTVDLPTSDRTELGCVALQVPANPTGVTDSAVAVTDGIRVRGWALDWTTPAATTVTVTVDGVAVATASTTVVRTDVAAAYPAFSNQRGFDVVAPARRGPHTVCVTASGRDLGCRTATVTDGDFADVDPGAYFAVPSRWMADTGLTTGYPNAWLFSPSVTVNRAQMVTFLWRFMGSPAAAPMCGWGDVPATAGYAVAACWARAAGVASGVGGDGSRFDPQGAVTRAQMAALLWRTAGSPPASGSSRFVDVDGAAWFADAASWLDVHAISTGSGSSGRFEPLGQVTRAQMSAFLWRLAGAGDAWAVSRPATAVR